MHRIMTMKKPLKHLLLVLSSLILFGCQTINSDKDRIQSNSKPAVLVNHSDTPPPIKLATITPVVESMSKALIENTDIEVIYLPSKRYSIKRIPGWLKKQDHNAFPKVDAIAGISSIWKELNAYPSFRLKNIRVIPIDLAHALSPGGERVALTYNSATKDKSTLPNYFWLNPSNAQIMIGILSRDLKALIQTMPYTDLHKRQLITQINDNQANMRTHLRKFQVSLDQTLMNLDVMQVTTDKPELTELLAATLLPEVPLTEAIEDSTPTLLITSRKKDHKKYKDLPNHMKVWSIDDFGKITAIGFNERWNNTLNNIQALH